MMFFKRRMHDDRGVAAITVMLVTSLMAVAGGMVVVMSTTEGEIGARDERAETAFTTAEGGLDVGVSHLVSDPTWSQGKTQECLRNPLLPAPDDACEHIKITSPSDGQFVHPTDGSRPYVEYTVLSKVTDATGVRRNLAATYKLTALDVPFAFYVDGDVDFSGTPNIFRISILVNGNVTSRDKVDFDFNLNGQPDDPDLGWNFHQHRIQSNPAPAMCFDASSGEQKGCAAVYSNFQIYATNVAKTVDEIHFLSNNPNHFAQKYPRDRDVHQTKFVNGVAQPVVTFPATNILEMMDSLKGMAEKQGLYFNYRDGKSDTVNFQPSNTAGDPLYKDKEFEKNVVVYIEGDPGDAMKWKVNLIPGSTSSDMKYTDASGQRVGPESGILVVRGGSLELEAGTQWSGAAFVPENGFRMRGNTICTCTIYAKGYSSSGGTSTIQLTPEWFNNLPAGFTRATRTGFFECEPFQESAVCPPE